MSGEVRYEEDLKIVRSILQGPCTMADYIKNATGIVELSNLHGTEKCFVDLSVLENKAELVDIMELPELYRKLNAPVNLKLSILSAPDHKDEPAIRFYETVCLNRGWNARIFTTPDQAMEWLLQT